MVVHVLDENLQHVRTIRQWRGEFGRTPPFDIGDDTLFVAYSAWAELTIFMTLGWKFPKHVFDLHTAYLAASNVLAPHDPDNPRKREHKRLPDACRAYGIEGWEQIDKGTMAQDIGEGRWRKYGQEAVFDYCEEDVRNSVLLLIEQLRGRPGRPSLPPASVKHVLHWSNYSAKAVAQIQARGMLIDMHLWNLVQENKAAVIRNLLQRFDPSHGSDAPIYTPEGEWSYERFEQYLVARRHSGVAATGERSARHRRRRFPPDVPRARNRGSARVARQSRRRRAGQIAHRPRRTKPTEPVSVLHRHRAKRPRQEPLQRARRHAVFHGLPPDAIGVYLDWRTQEVGILAAHSEDQRLKNDYRSGDVYHALAKLCGLTTDDNIKRWKAEHPDVRQRMKPLQLGINYGMGVPSLAKGLDRHPLIASGIIERHKRRYPRAWEYRAERVQAAMLDRCIETEFGWPLYLSTESE